MKKERVKFDIPNNRTVDATKGDEQRRMVERIIKNANFAAGSKHLPNTPEAQQYRYKRKTEQLLN